MARRVFQLDRLSIHRQAGNRRAAAKQIGEEMEVDLLQRRIFLVGVAYLHVAGDACLVVRKGDIHVVNAGPQQLV